MLAFNHDKPYDRFLTEQIAGDELDSSDPECVIAVGFLLLGPWEHQSMAVAAESRQQLLDDMVDTVGSTFLGVEMSCFKCHDHKFDPLPTRDYYRLQAVFAPVNPTDHEAAFLPRENTSDLAARRARFRKIVEDADRAGTKLQFSARFRTERAVKGCEPLAMSVYNGSPNIRGSRDLHARIPADPGATPSPVRILAGGSSARPGEEVTPGVPSALDVGATAIPVSRTVQQPVQHEGRHDEIDDLEQKRPHVELHGRPPRPEKGLANSRINATTRQ